MALVSVVIPAYNAGHYVEAAIESVLSQSFSDYEVLVVDDGSSDDTSTRVRRYQDRVRYVGQQNAGVSMARNHGIELATGRYVAFLDADDTWLPNKLERQVAQLLASAARVSYSAFEVVDERLQPLGVRRSPRHSTLLEDLLLRGNVVGSICTVLAERKLFDEAGGFDARLSQCADWEMWLRLALKTDFLYLDEPLVTYRQHATNMSRSIERYERDALYMLDKTFARADLPEEVRRLRERAYGRMFVVLAGSYFRAREWRPFVRCAMAALRHDPSRLAYFAAYPLRALARSLGRSETV